VADRVRIGAVGYLNTRALIHGIAGGLGAERIELSYDVPSGLARDLAAGHLDVALLPVIELARQPGLEVVPGLGIVTRGAARSVLLVSRREPAEVRSVALDPESRTSNGLVQVLFDRVWGAAPRFVAGSTDLAESLADCDAAVRIGDKALFEPLPAGCRAWDLGETWTGATGLPFVWAVWAARAGVVDRELYRMLHESRRRGARAVDEIAAAYAWRGHRDPELSARYLREHILHRLGGAEVRAIELYLAEAARLGLIDAAPKIAMALGERSACHETAADRAAPTA